MLTEEEYAFLDENIDGFTTNTKGKTLSGEEFDSNYGVGYHVSIPMYAINNGGIVKEFREEKFFCKPNVIEIYRNNGYSNTSYEISLSELFELITNQISTKGLSGNSPKGK